MIKGILLPGFSPAKFLGEKTTDFSNTARSNPAFENLLKNSIVMSFKNNSFVSKIKFVFVNFASALLLTALSVKAQMPAVPVPSPEDDGAAAVAGGEDFTWWYISLFVLALGLGGAVFWLLKTKREAKEIAKPKKSIANDNWETKSLDADREMEWLRKNQNLLDKSGRKRASRNAVQKNAVGRNKAAANGGDLQAKDAAEIALPIFSIERVELARPFAPLPLSNDDALMSAVEQTHDEFEEDEEVRDLALRILQAFKTRNSVEALSQMALYDLSSSLRSKAVNILADFNHESVFETVLLASADPTREVRAAAARALSKLTLDRADAWTRIFESDEPGRIGQAARAAVESGFVEMSFDRLVHQDKKYSYEAFVLMVLLVKAGETEPLFKALETHKNINVRRAILHVVKVTKDEQAVEKLCRILECGTLPLELREEADKTVEEIGYVTA